MPKRVCQRHIANQLRNDCCGKKYNPRLCAKAGYRIAKCEIDDEHAGACANSNKPDVDHRNKMNAASFGKKIISAIKESGKGGHQVADTEAWMQNEVGPHDQYGADQGDPKPAPEDF